MLVVIDTNNSQYGYNLTEGGEGAVGYKHTQETINLLSSLAKQKVGILNPFYGKKHKPEVVILSTGENNKSAKLTEQKVIELLNLYYTGQFTEEQLAKIFMVKRQTINDILRGKRWKHIKRNIEQIAAVKAANKRK